MDTAAQIEEPAQIENDATAQIEDPVDSLAFLLGGRSTFTLRSTKLPEKRRFTFKITKKRGTEDFFFVNVLTGPDIYSYLGCIVGKRYVRDRKLGIGEKAFSRVAFEWFFARVVAKKALSQLELWHQGSCSRCGRSLTDPASIKRGLGPICVTK